MINAIEQYVKLILKENEKVNLTRIQNEDQVRLLHIEDSLSVLDELEKAPEGLYADLGTGAGFPGVPLALASGRTTLLVDSVQKKISAIEASLRQLDIDVPIFTYAGRIEDLAKQKPEQFTVVTARALTSLPSLLELAAPLLQPGGHLISLKSHVDEDEISWAIGLQDVLGMKLLSQREFYLSDDKTYRTVLVFEKISEPKVKLPRKTGLAQKRPLKRPE